MTNAVEHAFGSANVTFGEEETQIVCAIKADIAKPLPSELNKG